MSWLIAVLSAVLTLGLTLGGCSPWGAPGAEPVGAPIASWSEAEAEVEGLSAVADSLTPAGLLIVDDAARDAFVATLPHDVDGSVVERADLDASVLVVGAYPRCMELGQVFLDEGAARLWFEAAVAPEDEGVACEWSPLTVEAWAVPHDALGGVAVADLVLELP